MASIVSKSCNSFLKSVLSYIAYWIMGTSSSKFYVVYPPLEHAEEIRTHPERFDPREWPREDVAYSWFHEANSVADKANLKAGKVLAIVFEVIPS